MIDYDCLTQDIARSSIAGWEDFFLSAVRNRLKQYTHGELEEWQNLMSELPALSTRTYNLKDSVSIGTKDELNQQLTPDEINRFIEQLKILHPWRKGPFDLFGVQINTEWRSDWKWDRVLKHLSPLKNRTILDVGCGNGYHCLRMSGEQARFVMGIDPSQKFLAQFSVIKKYIGKLPVHLLPIGIEDMPASMEHGGFDTVFSMGVLYHRKSPVNHLLALKNLMGTKGELVLETLVVDGDKTTVLVPSGRYAQMRNVWFLPSVAALELWLAKAGFKNIRTVDVNQTSTSEQRATDWMTFHSLQNYLDPNDFNKTVEGHPAPKRAVLIANK